MNRLTEILCPHQVDVIFINIQHCLPMFVEQILKSTRGFYKEINHKIITVMKYVDLKKILYMDFLIQKERTGNPDRFAQKVELSRSTLFEYIAYLRNDLMLKICYDEYRKTYYYEDENVTSALGKLRCETCKDRMLCAETA